MDCALYNKSADCHKKVPCGTCRKEVVAEFEPAWCHHHRNRIDIPVGWAWMSREEACIITILRKHGWVEEAIASLKEREQETAVESLTAVFQNVRVDGPRSDSGVGTPPAEQDGLVMGSAEPRSDSGVGTPPAEQDGLKMVMGSDGVLRGTHVVSWYGKDTEEKKEE